ncbi:putative ABC transport system permease protein [Hamadaea flava]|uniref:ABC transporter permease n=1 Tax=Hamadaea flava TaxID=1742688 RepID=A0ABV8M0N8_9ACTN|nr:FtsX-like permease family protein [Hamadaea flava]MCP2328468.1 putative ABC transport system permease protein [Hamadaea flava]
MLRATLKSLLARKLRLALSAMAVILGVMFVAGSFVLTDTLGRSFESMFDSAYAHTDVVVQPKPKVDGQIAGGDSPVPGLLTADDKKAVEAVTGVAAVHPIAEAEGARVIGSDGKVVTTVGPPRLGSNWLDGVGGAEIRDGHAPQNDNQVVLNVEQATKAGLKVGDQVTVLTPGGKRTFELAGTFGYAGGLDGRGGVLEVRFTEKVAQELMLGQPGAYTSFDVDAAPGQSVEAVRDAIAAKTGGAYEVKTGAELAKSIADQFKSVLDGLNKVLLGFGGVALFVGTFLILNIFSITVAQRTKELALTRALGASRRQMIGSVLAEALVVGLAGSVLGLLAGLGVGWVLAMLAANVSGLVLAPIALPASAVIAAFSVGIVITVLAALLPALRASRVPPIAALQEVATPDRPLTKLTVGGGLVTAVGVALMGYGLTGNGHLWPMLGGVMFAFIGVALLSPMVGKPLVAALGRLFSWSVAGKLGRLNSGRNPRRTAITAAALMIGIALITAASTVLTSGDQSLRGAAAREVHADLLVSGQESTDVVPTFARSTMDDIRKIPGVASAASEVYERALVGKQGHGVEIVDDLPALATQFSLKAVGGSLSALGPTDAVVDTETAVEDGVRLGDTVRVVLPKGDPVEFRIAAIYTQNDFMGGYMLGSAALEHSYNPDPAIATITLADGASEQAVRDRITALLAGNPEVTVMNKAEYLDQASGQIGTLLTMVTILLALAILIAVLGVIITLWLSVLERTRELGLLRAIGLGRAATMRMITVEAVVITLFGTLLGLATGVGMGAAVVRSLKGEGITDFAVPWSQLTAYLVAGALVGVFAAVLPSIKAARTDVLKAIAYE